MSHIVTLRMDRYARPATENEQLATLFERLARKEIAQRLLRRMGLDPRQFVLFLELFRTLSEREQFISSIGVNRFNLSYLALWTAAITLAPWSVIVAYQILPAPIYLTADLSLTFVLVFLLFIREAANALFNPVEACVLSHKPIHSATYAAAKIAHIIIAVLYLVSGLNLYPALIGFGLSGARWYWPATHLASAFLIGFWTALLICAFYGLIRRWVPAIRLKSVSMWIQLLSCTALVVTLMFFPKIFFKSFWGELLTTKIVSSPWTWLPLTWFLEIGRMGCRGNVWRLGSYGELSILGTILFVWFGLRNFSGTYLLEVSSTKVNAKSLRTLKESTLSRCYASVVRAITGSSLGLGAYSFIGKMVRRDWLYRRTILKQTWIPLLVILTIFLSLARGNTSSAFLLPHFLGLIMLALCVNLPFTGFNTGSWIYLIAPIKSARAFARGLFWALWIPMAGLPHIALLALLLMSVNWNDALFIAGFDLIVCSLYLAFEIRLISGLPFAIPVDESRTMIYGIYIQVCGIMAIVFPLMAHRALAAFCGRLSVSLFTGIALLVIFRFVLSVNLDKLEKEILWRIYAMKMGPNRMFREIE